MTQPTAITATDILPMAAYGRDRRDYRRRWVELKANRRVEIGPFITLSFECFQSMWLQVHEMLYIERGGEEQLDGELAAYNPLIPQGEELVATLMVEINDPARRGRELARLGGLERAVALEVAGLRVSGIPEADVNRTTAEGKTSAVHFLHFPFPARAIEAFRRPGAEVWAIIDHPAYRHRTVLPETVRAALAEDFA